MSDYQVQVWVNGAQTVAEEGPLAAMQPMFDVWARFVKAQSQQACVQLWQRPSGAAWPRTDREYSRLVEMVQQVAA